MGGFILENFDDKKLNIATLMKIQFKPEYSNIYRKINDIKIPIKNHILMTLLDGKWHTENEILRITRKQNDSIGSVTLSSMVKNLNLQTVNSYLRKKMVNGRIFYKISDNYLGLTKAAFTKFRFKSFNSK